MKLHKTIIVGALAAFLSIPTLHGEEMIDLVKAIFKDKQPVQIGRCEDIRELKYPGQKYWHTFEMTISGQGQVVTPRCFGWFKTRKVIHLVHSSKLILVETVVSTKEELEEGIIRAEYRVQRLDEQLGQSRGEYKIGNFSSKDVFDDIKTICEKYGSDKVENDPWMWAYAPGLKIFNKFLLWGDKRIASDGTIVLTSEDLAKTFPEYENLVSKYRNFRGTVIKSTWKFGEGYTSIAFESSQLDSDTKESLAKLIYRTNPISVKEILPDGKRSGDKWMIDSEVIGGIVYDLGIDFDDVDGAIMCRHQGTELKDGDDLPDEYALIRKQPLKMQALEIPRDRRSRLELVSRKSKLGDIAIAFSPYGSFSVFDDYDKDEKHLYYLKEAHLEGVLQSKVKRRTSLLKDVEFKDANLKIKLNYVQNRMAD